MNAASMRTLYMLACAVVLVGCQPKPSPEGAAALPLDTRIMGEWVDTMTGYSVTLNADGSGVGSSKTDGEKTLFKWSTKEEGIYISDLPKPSSVWPKYEGEYDYLYRAEAIPGAASIMFSRSAPSGSNVDPKTLGPWSFERR